MLLSERDTEVLGRPRRITMNQQENPTPLPTQLPHSASDFFVPVADPPPEKPSESEGTAPSSDSP